MSLCSSLNCTSSSPCKSKVEGETVGSRPIGCVKKKNVSLGNKQFCLRSMDTDIDTTRDTAILELYFLTLSWHILQELRFLVLSTFSSLENCDLFTLYFMFQCVSIIISIYEIFKWSNPLTCSCNYRSSLYQT